jgi:outer membrane protein OmpA-like peptidoglycan-associated protein/tetratricopeptide (TPR) repeat protein
MFLNNTIQVNSLISVMKSIYLKTLFLFFAFICIISANAQWYDPAKVNKKLGYKYGLALNETKARNYPAALKILDECIAADKKFVDAYLSKAGILSEQKKYKEAIDTYRQAILLDSVYSSNILLSYSISLAGNGQFHEALTAVQSFLQKKNLNERIIKSAEYRRACYSFALEQQQKFPANDYVFAPKNLGDGVNSVFSEYLPSITIDGNTLVFTRRINYTNEDFYVSEKTNAVWNKAVPVPGDLNTTQNEGAQNISQDGKMIVFAANYGNEGQGSFDIYLSYLTKNGWGPKVNLGTNINTEYWETQPCLSPDKRTLYFTATDPSGFGGSDIYVSYLQTNGRWGKPFNLGAGINTKGDESCPFIHADNQTLYFTSNGHPGYGGTDLFFVRRQPDGSWTKPQNLGYPINTIDDEGSLIIAGDARTAYFSSDRFDSKGGLDIYSFELPARDQPFKTLWVKGNVFDKKTKQGLPSAVELIDLSTAQTTSKVQTDEEGNYLVTLPVGKDYAFNVNRKGYLFFSENFPLSKNSSDSTYTINIPLSPIEADASVVLKNIFFDSKQFVLKPQSLIELDKVVQMMNENPGMKIEIGGHTDNVGKPADNLLLSNNRAKAVVNYLLGKGIAANRLAAKGFGETKPVASNNTENGRAENRRTELKVLAK